MVAVEPSTDNRTIILMMINRQIKNNKNKPGWFSQSHGIFLLQDLYAEN